MPRKTAALFALLALALTIALASPPATFAAPFSVDQTITAPPLLATYQQIAPDICGSKVVFLERSTTPSLGKWMVRSIDIDTGDANTVASGSADLGAPRVTGDWYVWADLGDYSLHARNWRTGATLALPHTSPVATFGADRTGRVSYIDVRNGTYRIYLYDLNTQQETLIADAGGQIGGVSPAFDSQLSGNTFAWGTYFGGWGVSFAHLGQAAASLTPDLNGHGTPIVSDDYIVWQNWSSPTVQVYDLNSETSTTITPPVGYSFQGGYLPTNASLAEGISHDRAVFDISTAGGKHALLLADLRGGFQTILASNLTSCYPSIDADRIVYCSANSLQAKRLIPPTLTASLASPSGPWSSSPTISGTLQDWGAPITSQAVRLEARIPGGAWQLFGQALTDANGHYSFTAMPAQSALEYRTAYAGTFNASVPVASRLSATSAAVSYLPQASVSVPTVTGTLKHGKQLKITGSVLGGNVSGAATVKVELYQVVSGKLVLRQRVAATVGSAPGGGPYTAYVTPSKAGTYKVRAIFVGNAQNAASNGPYKQIKVK